MFAVAKYGAALEKLRKERDIEGLFQHNLTAVDASKRTATFKTADGNSVTREFDLLHVVPPQGPLDFVKNSPLGMKPF
jgi:NADPH-dependent 2,4-dienoyl-CoA reductase/sulfur reductase-like enzyme